MAVLSYAIHASLIDWLKGTPFPTPPTSLDLALLTGAPNPDGSDIGNFEVAIGSYARQEVTLGSISTSNGISTVRNSAPLLFPTATADWPAVTHAAVLDQSGALIAYGPLPAPRVVKMDDALTFGANAIQLRLR